MVSKRILDKTKKLLVFLNDLTEEQQEAVLKISQILIKIDSSKKQEKSHLTATAQEVAEELERIFSLHED